MSEIWEDIKKWASVQPNYMTYDRLCDFISDLTGKNLADSELEIADLVNDNRIRLIAVSDLEVRVFIEPIPDLTESDIREVWDSPSSHLSTDTEWMMRSIHHKTGKTYDEIFEFFEESDNIEATRDEFRWLEDDTS